MISDDGLQHYALQRDLDPIDGDGIRGFVGPGRDVGGVLLHAADHGRLGQSGGRINVHGVRSRSTGKRSGRSWASIG